MSIEWSDELATGVESIDKGLRTIIDTINEIRGIDKHELTEEQTEDVIRFFGGHVIDHFKAEEELMLKHKCPDYDVHKEEHMRFLKNFAGLKKLFRDERSPVLMVSVIEDEYLKWLVKHIKKHDKTTASFLKARR